MAIDDGDHDTVSKLLKSQRVNIDGLSMRVKGFHEFVTPLIRAWGQKGWINGRRRSIVNELLNAKADMHAKGSDGTSFYEEVHSWVCTTLYFG